MKRILLCFAFLLLTLASKVDAQAACTRISPIAQTCAFNLTWQAPVADATHDPATSYAVQRKIGTGAFVDIATVTVLNYTDTIANDPGNTLISYQVISANAAGRDGPSNLVARTTPVITPALPNPPTGLQVSALSGSQVRLTWKDNSKNEIGFQTERNGAINDEYAMNTTTAVDGDLHPRTWYTYRIRALGDAGTSAWSNSVKTKTLR